ncbi:hypothetical protein [Nocardioides sp.]|jgi:hypothetical protein|uniref:hypothetical protein n=1 Tax=Nocardioides sp. TaxID=35761 RepID=UPI002F41A793
MTNTRRATVGVAAVIASGAAIVATSHADAASKTNNFQMHRSPGIVAAGCLPDAKAKVSVRNRGPVEEMKVHATGLPHRTDFDLFVIQVPNAPFGVSWYQGDLETDQHGVANGTFVGRFNEETFAIAPGTAPAPSVHSSPIPDATSNPAFGPVHTFHLGLWFNSPEDAVKAGCPGATTPFNGEHNAGVQVLNTDQFGDRHGPLRRLKP